MRTTLDLPESLLADAMKATDTDTNTAHSTGTGGTGQEGKWAGTLSALEKAIDRRRLVATDQASAATNRLGWNYGTASSLLKKAVMAPAYRT